MAKLKKNVRRKATASKANANDLQARAEEISRSLVGTAQQIWSAGVGAFSRAQGEGSKLFEALVKEGMNIEQHTRKLATGRVDAVRDAVENRVGSVRERATDTWDRLEKVFEERVQRALHRLGVPGREELVALTDRVDALTTQLKRGGAAPAVRKLPVKKAAKAPAKKVRKAARKSLPKTPKPVAPKA
ncbi:phasin family protein [Arenimonas sp.]|uniref:phasin family protein n=1 Tax=Arenimonas sp. TaxID=1872635 RepID=UPI0039E26DA8